LADQDPTSVLDASALLAFLQDEPGADAVDAALFAGAAISAVNWAETLTKLVDFGHSVGEAELRMAATGVVHDALVVLPFDRDLARETAALRTTTRAVGLSVGDRACLALARRLALPVLTTDRAWRALRVGVEIRVVR